VGILYAIYNFSLGLTLLAGGFLADHFDTKKIMIASALLWIPVPLLLAIATDWNQLWLPMILYGTYFSSSAYSVYILKTTRPEKIMQTFGLWSASVALGYVFSPIIGGYLTTIIGKQIIFLLSATIFATSIIPLLFLTTYHKTEPPKESLTPQPQLCTKPYNLTKLISLCVFFALIMFIISLLTPLIPQFTNGFYHQSLINLGIFGTATATGWIVFAISFGKVGDKYSKMIAVLALTAITSISFFLIVTINDLLVLCIASFLSGASSVIWGIMPAIIGTTAPVNAIGRWISISQLCVSVAGFGAPIIGGALYEISPYLAFGTAIAALSCLTIIGLISYKKTG
jgi:MFS family permease